MKKLILITLSLIISISVFAQKKNDKAQILKVMENETSSYYNRNYEGWADTWIHDASVHHIWNLKNGGYVEINGWTELNKRFKKGMEDNPEIIHPNFYATNMKFSIGNKMAYVNYDEYTANKEGTMYTKAVGIKIFRKVRGKWKLAGVSSFWDYKYSFSKSDVKDIVDKNL